MAVVVVLLLALHGLVVTAQQQECINDEIRTVTNAGDDYIQYCVRGEWRLHCTGVNLWRGQEAAVACRQLGYSGFMRDGGPRADNPGEALTSTKFFRFPDNCTGTENTVRECGGGDVRELDSCDITNGRHGIAECEPAVCTNGEIRLVNGSTNNEGRVEVCMADGRWGTVCNNQEGLAGAVCAQLDFSHCGAAVGSFVPSTPPSLTCTMQSGADPLLCITGSCDLSPSLGVVCRTLAEIATNVTNLINCATERNEIIAGLNNNISTLSGALEQCMSNATETERILQNNITTINNTLQQQIDDISILNERISNKNETLQQCMENVTDTMMDLQMCKDNITTLNGTLQQCVNNATETEMDLETCNSNTITINNNLQQCMQVTTTVNKTVQKLIGNISSINKTLWKCSAVVTDMSALSMVTTPALGAVIGLLVVVLMIAVVGWIVTCVKLSRSCSVPRSKNTAWGRKNESYSLQQAVCDEATPTQDNYSSLGPNYNVLTTNTEDIDTYDVIGHNQQAPPTVQPEPAHLTPAGASKKGDDFYDAEEHTYAMVNKKVKKKAPKDEEEEIEDPPIYENSTVREN